MNLPRDFSLVLAANVAGIIEQRGRFFGVIDAPTAALDIEIDGASPALRVGPGGSIFSPDSFSRVRITSSVNQTVRVRIADQVQDVSNIVTASGGSPTINVNVTDTPSATIASPAADVILTATALAIAANPTRLRLSLGARSTNTGSVFVQAPGAGAGRGLELQPGLVMEFRTRAALDVRNDSGASQTINRFEES